MADKPFKQPRPMSERDVEAVANLHGDVMANPWSRQAFRDSLAGGHACCVLEVAGELAACMVARHLAPETELLTIATRREHQRRGIARYLLKHLLQESAARGMSCCSLEVRADNEAAIALYRHHGFTEVGRRPAYYPVASGERVAAIVMRKEYGEPDETD